LAERGLCKPEVRGSSPLTSTNPLRADQNIKSPVDIFPSEIYSYVLSLLLKSESIKNKAPALERSSLDSSVEVSAHLPKESRVFAIFEN
jgi:hypothetical protein